MYGVLRRNGSRRMLKRNETQQGRLCSMECTFSHIHLVGWQFSLIWFSGKGAFMDFIGWYWFGMNTTWLCACLGALQCLLTVCKSKSDCKININLQVLYTDLELLLYIGWLPRQILSNWLPERNPSTPFGKVQVTCASPGSHKYTVKHACDIWVRRVGWHKEVHWSPCTAPVCLSFLQFIYLLDIFIYSIQFAVSPSFSISLFSQHLSPTAWSTDWKYHLNHVITSSYWIRIHVLHENTSKRLLLNGRE